ncbi:FUSC family protein [Vibrio rumoiensis]|uniref:FUSC family protein n=1 Tax=Vibrio rumoiensis TaxID=76258 RepID=A0ABW7J0E1_9VIBR
MYVPPRPKSSDDPNYAIRIALASVLSCIVVAIIQPSLPMMLPALTIGLIGSIRRGFDAKRAFGGPIALIVSMSVFSILVSSFHAMPIVLLTLTLGICTIGYYIILQTGNPAGMLILIGIVLMSSVGLKSIEAMEIMRDTFIEACLIACIIIPVCYAIIPPKNHQPLEDECLQDPFGHHWRRAFIRAGVLFLLIIWLYTVLDSANIMLAIAAVFTLVFPTRQQRNSEAKERILASLIGGGLALSILGILTITAHLSILLILIALAGLYLGNKMMHGTYPPMTYQFALSTMLVLIFGGLSTQEPLSATTLRVCLTIVGAISATILTTILEIILLPSNNPLLKLDHH